MSFRHPRTRFSLAPKLRRVNGVLWGCGLKLYPEGRANCIQRWPAYEWMNQL